MARSVPFRLMAAAVLFAILGASTARAQCFPVPLGELTRGDPADDDAFGAAVSVDGPYAVVGAPGDDDLGEDSGSAYVFMWDGSSWMQVGKLLAGDGTANDRLGTAVGVSGNKMAIGAPGNDGAGLDAGAVYCWGILPGVPHAKLSPGAGAGSSFGQALDIAGDLLVIGAPGAGIVEIYRYTSNGWTFDEAVQGDPSATQFGRAVATDGVRILIGSQYLGSGQQGVAAVLEEIAGMWTITDTVGESNDGRRGDVDLLGDRLIVGRPGAGLSTEGKVDFYDLINGSWSLRGTVSKQWVGMFPYCIPSTNFGGSIDMSGDWAVIGNPSFGDLFRCGYGAAHVFQDVGDDWIEMWAEVGPTTGYSGGHSFSRSVAMDGGTILIGDPNSTDAPRGACKSLTIAATKVFCTAKSTTLPGCLAGMSAAGTPSASSPEAFEITTAPVRGGQLGIYFWGRHGEAAIPFQGSYLCMQPPVLRSTARLSGGTPSDCDGRYSMFLTEIANKDPSFGVGVHFVVQTWFRDPGNVFSSALSDGLSFVVCY